MARDFARPANEGLPSSVVEPDALHARVEKNQAHRQDLECGSVRDARPDLPDKSLDFLFGEQVPALARGIKAKRLQPLDTCTPQALNAWPYCSEMREASALCY